MGTRLRSRRQERFPRLVRSLPSDGHRIVDFACGEHHVVVLTSEGVLFERLQLNSRALSRAIVAATI